jgi:hypothetical protein
VCGPGDCGRTGAGPLPVAGLGSQMSRRDPVRVSKDWSWWQLPPAHEPVKATNFPLTGLVSTVGNHPVGCNDIHTSNPAIWLQPVLVGLWRPPWEATAASPAPVTAPPDTVPMHTQGHCVIEICPGSSRETEGS